MKKTKNTPPKISIIMPSFNSEAFIARSIESVLTQNYPDYELFIKDGKSTDKTLQIIKSYQKNYPEKIKFISSKDKGQSDAINIGIKKTSGEIISYLNSDDIYKPNALNLVGNFFGENEQTNWVFGKVDIIDSKDNIIRQPITAYKNFWINIHSYNVLLILNYISQMGVFIRRKTFNQIGEFDINENYVMDYDYWLRLYKQNNPGIIKEYLASFRITSLTKSSTGFNQQFNDELRVAKQHTDNKLLIALHEIHNNAIRGVYKLLKIMNTSRSS